MGPVEKTIFQQSQRQGLPLPDRIANAPELRIGLDLFFTAFSELSSCRAIGMSLGPIPWTAIDRYCDANGITGDQRDDVFFHVVQLDSVYLEWQNKKTEAKIKSK